MITKGITIEKMDDAGTGLARIAQLSAVDSDGDTYLPGAFSWKEGGQQWCQILPAHDRRAMPLGKARVYEDGDWAMAELHLNLDTQAGRDWHAALKFDLAKGASVQEYSYGFDVVDADFQQRGTDRVRLLKRLDVHEVSPVLKGAGVGTGTITIKGAALKEEKFAALIGDLAELTSAIGDDIAALSATGRKQLGEIHVAIGKALAPVDDTGCRAADFAIADYLALQARRHLPG